MKPFFMVEEWNDVGQDEPWLNWIVIQVANAENNAWTQFKECVDPHSIHHHHLPRIKSSQ
jgi:hypothetical protein